MPDIFGYITKKPKQNKKRTKYNMELHDFELCGCSGLIYIFFFHHQKVQILPKIIHLLAAS